MTLGARAIVENKEGQILLVRHTYTKGLYLPGGGVEHGEPIETALRRELEEEGGVKLLAAPTLLGVFCNHRIMRNDHVLLYKVAAEDWTPCGDPIGREISEIVWCDPLNPPDDTSPATKRRLSNVYGGKPSDLHW